MSRRRPPSLGAPVLLAAALFPGCGERSPSPEDAEGGETAETAAEAVTPARYLSGFAFVGTVPGGSRLYFELVNETSSSDLARDYRSWMAEGERWGELLDLRDTLPLPRAAWRVLPGAGLQVLVGDRVDVPGLIVRDSLRRLRLLPGGVIAEWTGPTGQRELLALASLERDGVTEQGLLFFRRAARSATAPEDPGYDRILLLADARGNGLLVTQAAPPGAPARPGVAWGWLDGVRTRWSDAVLRGPAAGEPEAAGDETRWAVEIASAAIAAELEIVDAAEAPPAVELMGPFLPGRSRVEPPRISLLVGSLREGGEERAVHGVALQNRLP